MLGGYNRTATPGIARPQSPLGIFCLAALCAFMGYLLLSGSVLAQSGIAQTPNARSSSSPKNSRLASKSSFREIARQMLGEAKKLAKRGDIKGARRLATRANSFEIDWTSYKESPTEFLRELDGPKNLKNPVKEKIKRGFNSTRTGHPQAEEKKRRVRIVPTPLPFESSIRQRRGIGRWKSLDDTKVKSADLYVPESTPAKNFATTDPFQYGTNPQNSLETAPPVPGGRANKSRSEISIAPALLGLRNHSIKKAETPVAVQATDSTTSLMTTALVQLASTFAGFMFGLLALSLVLPFLVRKYASKLGTIFQVELVNSQSSGLINYVSSPEHQTTTTENGHNQREGRVVDFADQPFPFKVVGSEYEDERRIKEEASRERETEIMKHIFEQNLELRDQISELRECAA